MPDAWKFKLLYIIVFSKPGVWLLWLITDLQSSILLLIHVERLL